MPIQLHPFDPARDTPRPNKDGSISTEVIRTVQLPDGRWANVPSLWWSAGGAVRDFDSMDDDQLAGFAARYEQQSGSLFPRFDNLSNAETAAKARSKKGGATQGKLAGARPMPNFTPMGTVPDFYSQIMGDASRNLVRMQDGSYRAAPQTPPNMSVNDAYAGMYSPGAIQPQSAADARSEQNRSRQSAQRSMVPNNWGTSIGRMMDPIWENNDPGTIMTAAAMPQIPGPSGFSNLNKSQDRLSQGTGLAFAGDTSQPSGLAAITGATTPLPQMQPGMFGRGRPSMQWEQAVSSGPAPSGDPWGGMRIGEQSPPPLPGISTGANEITVRGGSPSRSAPAPLPRPAFTNPSATYWDRSSGSFVTGKQPPPLPKRPSAEIKTRLKAQQNGGNKSPKPAGYGSKGYSEAGRALQALYGN